MLWFLSSQLTGSFSCKNYWIFIAWCPLGSPRAEAALENEHHLPFIRYKTMTTSWWQGWCDPDSTSKTKLLVVFNGKYKVHKFSACLSESIKRKQWKAQVSLIECSQREPFVDEILSLSPCFSSKTWEIKLSGWLSQTHLINQSLHGHVTRLLHWPPTRLIY